MAADWKMILIVDNGSDAANKPRRTDVPDQYKDKPNVVCVPLDKVSDALAANGIIESLEDEKLTPDKLEKLTKLDREIAVDVVQTMLPLVYWVSPVDQCKIYSAVGAKPTRKHIKATAISYFKHLADEKPVQSNVVERFIEYVEEGPVRQLCDLAEYSVIDLMADIHAELFKKIELYAIRLRHNNTTPADRVQSADLKQSARYDSMKAYRRLKAAFLPIEKYPAYSLTLTNTFVDIMGELYATLMGWIGSNEIKLAKGFVEKYTNQPEVINAMLERYVADCDQASQVNNDARLIRMLEVFGTILTDYLESIGRQDILTRSSDLAK